MPVRKRRQKGKFEDILEERRKWGEIGWLMRSRRLPKYRFAEDDRTPLEFRTVTLDSDRVQLQLTRIAEETGRSVKSLESEAEEIMTEMGHELSLRSVKLFGFFLAKVMKALYRNIFINTEGIMKLRNAVKDYPVVLLPSHRSYADFLLMSFLCFDYDLPLPVIAAAMDFASMKFFGNLLRRCGAFFIRRSFASDPLYWLVFTEFVRVHLRSGQHPIEFFLEGTRSRTGKSLVPKTGMLGAILESWFLGEVSDVYLVPVSISYDRILEDVLYAYELLGVPKPKESTSGLLKARGILNEDFGDVHFFIHDPISLRRLADGQVDRSLHNLQPRFSSSLFADEMQFLKHVAFEVVASHQREFVISPWSLLATIISHYPSGIKREQLRNETETLRKLVMDLDGRLNWSDGQSMDEVIRTQLNIHPGLLEVDAEDRFKLLTDDDIMGRAAKYIQLVSYRNQLMHCLASEAILAVIMRTEARTRRTLTTMDQLAEGFNSLYMLLHREFAMDPRQSKKKFHRACSNLARLGLFSEHSGTVDLTENSSPVSQLLVRILAPFIYGYLTAAEALWMGVEVSTKEKNAAKAIQTFVFERAQRGKLEHFDALSLDLLNHALAIFTQHEVFCDGKENSKTDLGKLRKCRDDLNAFYLASINGDQALPSAKL